MKNDDDFHPDVGMHKGEVSSPIKTILRNLFLTMTFVLTVFVLIWNWQDLIAFLTNTPDEVSADFGYILIQLLIPLIIISMVAGVLVNLRRSF